MQTSKDGCYMHIPISVKENPGKTVIEYQILKADLISLYKGCKKLTLNYTE